MTLQAIVLDGARIEGRASVVAWHLDGRSEILYMVLTMRRRHLFELNDVEAVPEALRETIIESLGRTLAWGHILRGVVTPFRAFLESTQAREVLDLGSGAGDPVAILVHELAGAHVTPPRFWLSDLRTHPEAWARLRETHAGTIDFVAEPVDATRVPDSLGRGRARTIINALHHFPPDLAGAVLRGSAKGAPGVFVVEGFERNPLRFGAFVAAGLPALLVNPILSPRRRFAKACLTWLTPAALLASVWDGLVSTLRVYTEAELRAMVLPLGDAYDWTYGTWDFAPLGRGYYFAGVASKTQG